RMGAAAIDLELAQHGIAQRALWQHTLDGQLQRARGKPLLHLAEGRLPYSARIARVPVVLLALFLAAGDANLIRVHHDDIIARVDVRGVDRLVLPPKTARDLAGEPTKHLPRGIDDVPAVLDFFGLR